MPSTLISDTAVLLFSRVSLMMKFYSFSFFLLAQSYVTVSVDQKRKRKKENNYNTISVGIVETKDSLDDSQFGALW